MNFQIYKITKPDNYEIEISIHDEPPRHILIYSYNNEDNVNYSTDVVNYCNKIEDNKKYQIKEINSAHKLEESNTEILLFDELTLMESELLKKIISKVNKLKFKKNNNLIIEIGNFNTFATIEFIYLLSCLFQKTYIHKPLSSSFLKSNKYLVLLNQEKEIPNIQEIGNLFYHKIVKKTNNIFDKEILCINKFLAEQKTDLLQKIARLCKDKNYGGFLLQNCKEESKVNTDNYIEILDQGFEIKNDYICDIF